MPGQSQVIHMAWTPLVGPYHGVTVASWEYSLEGNETAQCVQEATSQAPCSQGFAKIKASFPACRKTVELPAGEATPVLQPLPRPPRRHSQRLAVPASAQPPTLLVAHLEGIQVSCHIISPPGLHMSRNIKSCLCAAAPYTAQ